MSGIFKIIKERRDAAKFEAKLQSEIDIDTAMQVLFDHMNEEHDLILLESEMYEIIRLSIEVAKSMSEYSITETSTFH